mmetsp:Transcript_65483/g.142823  ORF Transcript_65483/g.142823 Transcript_65483/m.142823 type:complete len:173 (+) Transcript_65483:1-519(+)
MMSYLRLLPDCESRDEAMTTTLLYVIHLNPFKGSTTQKQMGRLGSILNELSMRKRHLRPAMAVLLLRTPSPEDELVKQDDGARETWQTDLEDFELVHRGISVLGPISLNDSSSICSVFQSVVLSAKAQRQTGSVSLSSCFSGPRLYEAERDGCFEDEFNLDPTLGFKRTVSI